MWTEWGTHWDWMILGMVLIAVEAMIAGFFLLWMGIAALLVGLLLTIWPGLDWTFQVVCFAVCSLATIGTWRWRLSQHPTPSVQPLLNQRGRQYIGQVFPTSTPIVNGHGKLKVGDGMWKVQVDVDCPIGTPIRIVEVDGVMLKGKVEQ